MKAVAAALTWLSADPLARFAPRLFARDADNVQGTTSPATPAGAQAQPSIYKFDAQAGTSTYAPGAPTGTAQAVYFMSNDDNGANHVYAYSLGTNGLINETTPSKYSTNGTGRVFSYTGNTVQDALDSQGSLFSAGSRLYAVNAGSNTLQQFAINCTKPTQLIALGTAVPVNGNNPNSIAVAPTSHRVCVATTGQGSGIQCYLYSAGFGSVDPPQPESGTTENLPLPSPQSGNTVLGPADTVSQLLFTDDENYLIAVVKSQLNSAGTAVAKGEQGYILVYPNINSGLGTPVKSTPANTGLLFGCQFVYGSYKLFCADALEGAVYLTPNSNMVYSVQTLTPTSQIAGGATNCWTARSVFNNGPFYLSAVDQNYIASFQNSGTLIQTNNFATNTIGAPDPQLIEIQTAANYIYGLSFGNQTAGQHLFVAQDPQANGQLNAVQRVKLTGFSTSVDGLALFIPGEEPNNCDFH